MKRLRILTLISVVLAFAVFTIKNRQPSTIPAGEGLLVNKAWLVTNTQPQTPEKDVRPPDQTFLTFPEWFLVFSPAEQADYFKTRTSTTFPYMKHVDQLWQGYGIVYHQIKGNYPFNTGYHAMIMVIGVSTTIEYAIKSAYETVIGRITDTGENITDEDQFNATYELSYVSFIKDLPWYKYDFNHQLKQLWTNTSLSGPHILRKLERRYYLSTELLIKSGYGWLIGLGTKSAYDTALLNTTVVVDKPGDTSASVLMNLPRYAKFNTAVCQMADKDIRFKEIAGNKGAVMLTILTRKTVATDTTLTILFTQPIFTKPGLSRVAVVTTVGMLSASVKKLLAQNVEIEHVYDY